MANRLAALGLAFSCTFCAPAWSATLMEFRSGDGEPAQMMWLDGEVARVEGGGEPGSYSIFDLKNGRLFGVNPAQKQIVEYDFGLDGGEKSPASAAEKAAVKLEEKGKGPTLAGYATRHFVLTGDGEVCGEYFLSKEALADTGMRNVLGRLKQISAASEDVEEYDACDQAETFVIGEYLKLGLPMRQLDAQGELDHEIVRIQKGAALPAGGTDLPAGYKRISMEEYVQQMMRRFQQQKGN